MLAQMEKTMSARKVYFDDLLGDCLEAVIEADIPAEQQPTVIAAMILSDSLNGLRKAMLQNTRVPMEPLSTLLRSPS